MERIDNADLNYVTVLIRTELECDPEKGEYYASITGILGALDISPDANSDVELIEECIEENIMTFNLPDEGVTIVTLKESGERQDATSWLKYYVVDNVVAVN